MVIDELIAVLGFRTENLGAARGFLASVNSIDKQMQAFGRTIRNVTVSMGAYFALKNAVWTGLGSFGVIKASADWEVLERRLRSIVGTSQEVGEALKYIEDLALRSPYGIKETAEAFVKARGYGFNKEDTKQLLEGLMDTSFAMGKDLMMGVEAAADAVRGDFRRFREFYSMAWDAQSEQGWVTFFPMIGGKEVPTRVKKDFKSIFDFLVDYMNKRFKGAATQGIGSWTQMWDRLGDLIERFKRHIGQAGFFDFITDRLRRITDYIMANGDQFDRWAKRVSDGYTRIITSAEDFFLHNKDNIDYLIKQYRAFEDSIDKIAMGLGLLAVATRPFLRLLFQIASIFLMIDDYLSFKQGKRSIFGNITRWLQENLGMKKDISEIVTKWGYVIAGAMIAILPGILGGALGTVVGAVAGLFLSPAALIVFAVVAGAAVAAFIYYYREKIADTKAWQIVKDALKKVWEDIVNWLTSQWSDILRPNLEAFKEEFLRQISDPKFWQAVASVILEGMNRAVSFVPGLIWKGVTGKDFNSTTTFPNQYTGKTYGAWMSEPDLPVDDIEEKSKKFQSDLAPGGPLDWVGNRSTINNYQPSITVTVPPNQPDAKKAADTAVDILDKRLEPPTRHNAEPGLLFR